MEEGKEGKAEAEQEHENLLCCCDYDDVKN